jgi:hypothetical protein
MKLTTLHKVKSSEHPGKTENKKVMKISALLGKLPPSFVLLFLSINADCIICR